MIEISFPRNVSHNDTAQHINALNRIDVAKNQNFRLLNLCPYCGGDLIYKGLSWHKVAENQFSILNYDVICTTEPNIDSEMWDNWFEKHNEKLEKIQVPLDNKVLNYINKGYNFIL